MKKSKEFDEATAREQWAKWTELCKLAASLEQQNFFTPASAFESYVAGKTKSLDESFGLVAPSNRRGAPADLDRKISIGRKIDGLKAEGRSWSEITDTLSVGDSADAGLDDSSLRRIYREYKEIEGQAPFPWFLTPADKARVDEKLGKPLDEESPETDHTVGMLATENHLTRDRIPGMPLPANSPYRNRK